MHITAHIHDHPCAKRQELFHELGITPLAWGIDDHRRSVPRKGVYFGKDVRGISGEKGASVGGEVVQLGVCGGSVDGVAG